MVSALWPTPACNELELELPLLAGETLAEAIVITVLMWVFLFKLDLT
jgi:hypothetical protein